MCFFLRHIASIGLILDMIGVAILFLVVVSIGEQVILVDPEEEKERLTKKRKKEIIIWTGFLMIVVGFVLQLISNEMKIN